MTTKKQDIPDQILNFDKKLEQEMPKQKTAEEIASQADLLPRPTGYRVLILPRGRNSVTEGGIQLVKNTIEQDTISSVVGYVISLGPDAYKDTAKFPEGAWCKEGEWVHATRRKSCHRRDS